MRISIDEKTLLAAINNKPGITTNELSALIGGRGRKFIVQTLGAARRAGLIELQVSNRHKPAAWYPQGQLPPSGPPVFRPILRKEYLDPIKEAGGVLVAEFAEKIGVRLKVMQLHLQHLRDAGLLRSEKIPGRREFMYFVPGFESAKVKPKFAIKKQIALTQDKREAVIPPTVKVQVIPCLVASRFTFNPPPGWVGEITKDQRARRQEAA